MCGIGGILRVWPAEQREVALRTPHVQSIPERWLDILDDAVKHRGPDGHGRFRDRAIRADGCVVDVAFVHRRLSIIDHAGGHQPMLSLGKGQGVVHQKRLVLGEGTGLYERDAASELIGGEAHDSQRASRVSERSESNSDRVCVVFNGCIYNHRELRAELQQAGHVFSTDHSDTEVLVHGWREWGGGLFDRLDGMWSWIVWDARKAQLAFSRDRAGEKPLYVDPSNEASAGVVALASTASALWRLRSARGLDIAPDWFAKDLMWGFAEPAMGQMVQPVGACSAALFDEESGVHHPDYLYDELAWRFDRQRRSQDIPVTPDRVDAMLADAVSRELEADVPVACFLSGGIDSALIAAQAHRLRGSVRTFTVTMPDPRFDESQAAAKTAAHLGTEHSTVPCDAHPAADLVSLIEQLGSPLGDSSLLPTNWVCKALSGAGVRVALGGDGGDELFAGYDRHRAAGWLRRYSKVLRRVPVRDGGKDKTLGQRVQRLVRAARFDGYPDLLRLFSVDDVLRLTGLDGPRVRESSRSTFEVVDWSPGMDPRLYDYSRYLPYDLCAKVDTASMAHALETRAPMLARDLSAAALQTPLSIVTPRGQRKGLLRQVARKYLPAEIVDRPKMGFAIPIGEWFRSDYGGLRTMLLDHLNSTEPFGPPSLGIDLNMQFVRQMLDEHLGTGPSGIVKRDHSQRLYMLLVLSIWAKWLGGLKSEKASRREGVE